MNEETTNDRPVIPDDPAAEIEQLRAELAAALARAEESRASYLRAVAETDNVRKRAQREVEAAHKYGAERLASDLLDVRDSLELGIAAGPAVDPARQVEGMDATLRLLAKALDRAGVSLVDPQGQPFNPEFHEAMATQECADQPAGTVLAVVQKGYVLNGRLLRPARVLIARAPAEAPN